MTVCIGHFGGLAGTWFAELDFDGVDGEPTATILQRDGHGVNALVATVPIGSMMDEGDGPTLDTTCRVNHRLMQLVYAKDAWETIERVRKLIADRLLAIRYSETNHDLTDAEAEWADQESDMLDYLERALMMLDVPETT